jgi:hypothetical protein
LQTESFVDGALQAGFVDHIEDVPLLWKHGECRAASTGGHLRRFFDREARILRDDRKHHPDHDLEAPNFAVVVAALVCRNLPFFGRIIHFSGGRTQLPNN